MVPTAEQLESLSKQQQGELAQVPFAILLRALAEHRRTVVLELRRRQLNKQIVIENGSPVDCDSNLAHERLGRFLAAQGKMSDEEANRYFGQAISRGIKLGEVLIQDGVLTPWELYRLLQQNLAKKLLDGFSWDDGEYELHFEVPPVDSPLKVKVPQLILTGLSRFAPQREMDATVMTLIGKRVAVHPAPPVGLHELRLNAGQRALIYRLDEPRTLSDLEGLTKLGMDDISRYLYAFGILGLVVPEDQLPAGDWAVPAEVVTPAAPSDGDTASVPAPSAVELERLRNQIMTVYLAHRKQDAFDLLGLEEDADEAAIDSSYLSFAERMAPWSLAGEELSDLREKAHELFLAGARAYGELREREQRNTLIFRRQTLRQEEAKKKRVGPERIKTDLLDPEVQFRKGKRLMDEGEYREALQYLEFASDCDPQNGVYRAELAYCRYLWSPSKGEEAARELAEARRIDPRCGIACYYAGEVLLALERGEEAEPILRQAVKLMPGDRRPIEALTGMGKARRKR